MSKARERVNLPRGHYVIADLGPDAIRVDLLDMCLPARTGVPEDGWGGAVLTSAQAIELSEKLTAAAVRCWPTRFRNKRR